ncbi:acyl-CoA synthetase [Rhodococcus yananensis]|uniref:acyl-CoA synthetase n=1 Tax=Rhodococcus yananensis TaxID=2879464 RepID=UPI003EC0A06D
MALNIADLVEHAIDLVPERIALASDEREITYAQLEERANRLGHYLQERGVKPGDKVGIYSRNTVEAVEAMVAVFKIRAVMININYRYVENELQHIFDDSDMVALIHERRYSDKVENVLPGHPLVATVVVVDDGTDLDYSGYGGVDYERALAGTSPERDFGERSPDDIYMLYTGGTTGKPKGVMWRHEDVWRVLGGGIDFASGEYVADEWVQAKSGAENPGLVRLPVPPMIHGGAQWATLQALFGGSKAVMLPEFSGHAVWRAIDEHKVNLIFITGDAMAQPMLDAFDEGDPETGEPYDLSSLFFIGSSAALFSPALKDRFLDALPDRVISDSIGSSETGFGGIGFVAKGQSHVGAPTVKIDASTSVLDEDGNPLQPGDGKVGLLARSGHIPLGYYNDEEKSAKTFRVYNGVRYSIPGDYAQIEADGTVTMLGRGSVSINSGGEKIYPEEVEAALKAHPDVFDALVVGVPDDRFGQRVAAVVAARPGHRPALADLAELARTSIAGYKVPRSIWFVDEIKRSPAGKPDYRWATGETEARPADDHYTNGAATAAKG